MDDVYEISRNFAVAEQNTGLQLYINDIFVYLFGNGRVRIIANIRNK